MGYKQLVEEIKNDFKTKKLPKTDDCPLGGDAANCSACDYNADYFYFKGDCISRKYDESIVNRLMVYEDARAIQIKGTFKDNPGKGVQLFAVIEKGNPRTVDYLNEVIADDLYVLSCIYEML